MDIKKPTVFGPIVAFLLTVGGLISFFKDTVSFFRFIFTIKTFLLDFLVIGIPLWICILAIIFAGVLLFYYKRSWSPKIVIDSTVIHNRGQFYVKFQELLVTAKKKIVIVGLEKHWVFPLFISLFVARRRGVQIDVVYYFDQHERHYLLKLLGCRVFHANKDDYEITFDGVISDPEEILQCRAIVRNPRDDKDYAYGRFYFGSYDYYMIRSLYLLFQKITETAEEEYKTELFGEPKLVEVEEKDLIERLKRVRFYQNAKITIEEVNPSETYPVSNFVVPFKLNQVKEVWKIHDDKNWKLFHLCGVALPNGETSIIIPPVLEEHSGKLFVAEGHSRLFTAIKDGISSIKVVVVRGVNKDLPLKPTTWNKVKIVDEKHEPRDVELARYIETSVHKDTWIKQT